MKKLSYKKPLVEVMDFYAEDILRTSGNNTSYDGVASVSLTESGLSAANNILGVNTN